MKKLSENPTAEDRTIALPTLSLIEGDLLETMVELRTMFGLVGLEVPSHLSQPVIGENTILARLGVIRENAAIAKSLCRILTNTLSGLVNGGK